MRPQHSGNPNFPFTVEHDPSVYSRQLRQTIARCRRHHYACGVGLLALDDFAEIYSTYSDTTVEALLQLIAKRLQAAIREEDAVAYLGQDQFALLFDTLTKPADIRTLTKRLEAVFSKPFVLEDASIHVRTSIGLSVFPLHGLTPKRLIEAAQGALDGAKAAGGGSCWLAGEIPSTLAFHLPTRLPKDDKESTADKHNAYNSPGPLLSKLSVRT